MLVIRSRTTTLVLLLCFDNLTELCGRDNAIRPRVTNLPYVILSMRLIFIDFACLLYVALDA